MSKTVELTDEQVSALCPKREDPSDVVMIRSRDAGCFYGHLVDRDGDTVTLTDARRIWYWDGAPTLSDLATEGTSKPGTCKFPAPSEGEHVILGVCEIIPVTKRALKSLSAVSPWAVK